MEFTATNIPDVLVIEPELYGDERGFFMEFYEARKFAEAGIQDTFVQDNHSGSRRGTLRGLHYQIQQSQGKLVRVSTGSIYDVVVDLRRSSKTFGQWAGMELSAQNRVQVWVPKGFAHGFYVLSDWAEVTYKVTDFYAPGWERTLLWNDPELGIEWPLAVDFAPIVSAKDSKGIRFREAQIFE